MVRKGGLEPPHLAAPEPKSGVSTNSTTSAFYVSLIGRPPQKRGQILPQALPLGNRSIFG